MLKSFPHTGTLDEAECGDQQSLSEVRRGLLVELAMDFPKTAKIPASGFEDEVPFWMPVLRLFPKTF